MADAVVGGGVSVPGHALVEAFSVLTRLPYPHRLQAALVAEYLARSFSDHVVTLTAQEYAGVPGRMAAAGIDGGRTYDGLIAVTAQLRGLELLTLDRRALLTYDALGVAGRLAG